MIGRPTARSFVRVPVSLVLSLASGLRGLRQQGTHSPGSRPGGTGLGSGCQWWCARGGDVFSLGKPPPWREGAEPWSAQPKWEVVGKQSHKLSLSQARAFGPKSSKSPQSAGIRKLFTTVLVL